MAKKPHDELELEWMGRVKQLRCVLCELLDQSQNGVTEAHHPRTGQGGAQRGPDFLVAALCKHSCHSGSKGIHGDRARLRIAKVDEMDLVALTVRKVYEQIQRER